MDRRQEASGDGIRKVRVGKLVFDVEDGSVAGPLPSSVDWAARRITLRQGMRPGQRAEVLVATVQQLEARLRVRFIGRVG